MKFLICLFVILGVSYGAIPPKTDCRFTFCTMDIKMCPDGKLAGIPAGECCPSYSTCKPLSGSLVRRENPLSGLGSLLSGGNLLQTLSTATHGTNLGTAISILNLLNNVHQLSNDIHQIPLLINQTLASILNGTGQASQILIDQLIGAVTAAQQKATGRGLLDGLGQNLNLLSSIGHLLPQGTSISSIISILKLLSNINALNTDIHKIPALLNETIANIVGGAGQASEIVVQQILGLLGAQTSSRGLLDGLGQNFNLLSSIGHLLPQGTSISSIISILKLLNNINALNTDIHKIPALLNETITSIVGGAGQASQIVVQQILDLVGLHAQATSRDLLSGLTQNTNLLSTISHLLPQGTSISTVLSLLNLLNNVHAVSNDLHQIPAVLQETLQNILNGVQSLVPQAN